jgi:hypothetical protein
VGRRFERRGHACRHCGKRGLRWWRRGLCWRCYGRPEILARYPVPGTDDDDLATGRDFYGPAAPCPGPLPGGGPCPERVLALGLRADAGQDLFGGVFIGGSPHGAGGGPAGAGGGPRRVDTPSAGFSAAGGVGKRRTARGNFGDGERC